MTAANANYNDPQDGANITQILNNLLQSASMLLYHCVFQYKLQQHMNDVTEGKAPSVLTDLLLSWQL